MVGGGIVGGTVGAAIWAAIIYFTNYEVGYIAILIGILVGYCVKLGAGISQGLIPGLIAATLAIVSVAGGKYAAATIQAHDAVNEMNFVVSADMVKMRQASLLAEEKVKSGEAIKWLNGKTEETVESLGDYPEEIEKEVAAKWEALDDARRESQIAQHQKEFELMKETFHTAIRDQTFLASFSPYDLLFFGLATYAAFQLGANTAPQPQIASKKDENSSAEENQG
jgi:hypothetical protein